MIKALVILIAIEHIGFLALEMFLWKTPTGRKIFRTTAEFAEASAPLAANQGLYNGFLAAGLIWALAIDSNPTAIFFLSCVSVAGIFGAATVNRRIFFVQALPALLGLAALVVSSF